MPIALNVLLSECNISLNDIEFVEIVIRLY